MLTGRCQPGPNGSFLLAYGLPDPLSPYPSYAQAPKNDGPSRKVQSRPG